MGTTLTATVSQAILTALAARIANQSVFTAYDITTDVRDGTDDNIRHGDVRDIVSNEFVTNQFPNEYNREAVELNVSGNPWAVIYYPDGKSVNDHPKVKQSIALPAQIVPTAPTTNSTPASHTVSSKTKQGGRIKDGDGFICNVTCDGRINIPKELYSRISANGGTFDVHFNGSILYKKPIGLEERLVLKKSELAGGKRFRVGVDMTANTITVERI